MPANHGLRWAGELPIKARQVYRPGWDGVASLSDRFFVHDLPGVSISQTGIEVDPSAGYRRSRSAGFLEWLDAVRSYVQDAITRERAGSTRSDALGSS